MKYQISFSDITHRDHPCKCVPYGISMVMSYAINVFGDIIDAKIFKDVFKLNSYLKENKPKIACFSNYIWNTNISYTIAEVIKAKFPETIIVFGGPSYPIDKEEQRKFLISRPEIDFYIFREGEKAFVELFNILLEYNFNIDKLKIDKCKISNCHYIINNELIQGSIFPRVDIEDIPSPYLSGFCDIFLTEGYSPLIQTTRGCPFNCTYCQDGDIYYNKINRASLKRITNELYYIAKRAKSSVLYLGDSNFGMYEEDVEVCKVIRAVQNEFGWPKSLIAIAGKNNKDRVLNAASIVEGAFLSAAVQSTDKNVLKQIKRENVSHEILLQIAKECDKKNNNSFSEVILCLPDDNKNAHFKSISDLIDSGMNVVRSHQLIMLPGSEISNIKTRTNYNMSTRFRVIPNTYQPFQLLGKQLYSPEIDEICVANSTMSFSDYIECRLFNLSVEIFYNNGILNELIKFLKLYNISISSFIDNVHKMILKKSESLSLSKIYDSFLAETKELFKTQNYLKADLKKTNIMQKYIAGELGNNEQLLYRAIAILNHMDEIHKISFNTAKNLLKINNSYNNVISNYLNELFEYSLIKKQKLFSTDIEKTKLFHYDFSYLISNNFNDDPLLYYLPEGKELLFKHSDEVKKLIFEVIRQFGMSDNSIGHILSSFHVSKFYRDAVKLK